MNEMRSSLQKAMETAEKIGYMKAQNKMLKFVWELSKQGKISNDVAQMFALEFALDVE